MGKPDQREHVVPTVAEGHAVGGPAGEPGDGLADRRIAPVRVRPGVGAGDRVRHRAEDAFGQRPAALVPVEVDRDIGSGADVGGEFEHLGTDRLQRNGFHARNVTKEAANPVPEGVPRPPQPWVPRKSSASKRMAMDRA